LDGSVRRRFEVKGTFDFGTAPDYQTSISVIPSENKIARAPELGRCLRTNKLAPLDCLGRCELSGVNVLRHLLLRSEVSGRMALPEFVAKCPETGKYALKDEMEQSAVTGQLIVSSALQTSAVSGKRAEARYFTKCEFTGVDALEEEVLIRRVSDKKYRRDKEQRSSLSGKTGYTDEFIVCAETQRPLLPNEAEKCELTEKLVCPGILDHCEVTGKKVVPSELEKSAVSGKKALKQLFVSSSVSGGRLLRDEAILSATGKYCSEQEAKNCVWSGRKCHLDDLRTCQLTRITTHFEFMTANGESRFEPLLGLLNGIVRKTDKSDGWSKIIANMSDFLEARSQVRSSMSSPNGELLAVCVETKNWLGLKIRHAGFLYAIRDQAAVGRIAIGKREDEGWILENIV
jgi:hypothetical protein